MPIKRLQILSPINALVMLVLLCSTGPMPAFAEDNTAAKGITVLPAGNDSKNLDVVLVMDSSGSMKKTDPKELRKPAAKLFISLLGNNDRAGVVSFSDQGYPVAYLTPVKGNKHRQQLFKAVDRISSKGVYTNLHGAIEGALRVLDRDATGNTASNKRQRIIVLMSDGKMDLGNSENTQQQSQRLLLDTLPALKRQGIEVHTIAFTPQSDQALLKQIADTTGGTFNIARSDRDLHDAYTAIFEHNKSPNILPFHGEKFTIDKAIKEVTIVGSKDSAQVVLSLLTPDGRMLTPDDRGKGLKWFASDQFDLITITNPAAGEWQLKASNGKNKAYVITDLKQQLVIEPREPAVNEGVLIKTWLEDKGSILNKPSILQTLAVEMHVDTPDGQTHVLKMEPELAADGTPTHSGAYSSLIALPADGAYHFKVIASASTFSREKDSIVHAVTPIPASAPAAQTAAPQPVPQPEPAAATPAPPPAMPEPAPQAEQPPAAMKADTHEAAAPKAEPETAKKKPAPDKHKEVKPKESKTKAAEHDSGNSSVLTAVLIFLGINVMLGAIGGGAYFFIRWKRNKAAAGDEQDEADSGTDKADAKQDKREDKAA